MGQLFQILLDNCGGNVEQLFQIIVRTFNMLFAPILVTFLSWSPAEAGERGTFEDRKPFQKTVFYRSVERFLESLEGKNLGDFFEEAWRLSQKANERRFPTVKTIRPELAFGAPVISESQKTGALQTWKLLQKYVDLDAKFEGFRGGTFTELGYTVQGLRRTLDLSPRFVMETEAKLRRGVGKRGEYPYAVFRGDLMRTFQFGNDAVDKSIDHLTQRVTRLRIKRKLDEAIGVEKSKKFRRLLEAYLYEVMAAAIFAYAEASIEMSVQATDP